MLVAYAGEENRVDALRILLREMRTTKQYSNALEDIRFKSATHGSLKRKRAREKFLWLIR